MTLHKRALRVVAPGPLSDRGGGEGGQFEGAASGLPHFIAQTPRGSGEPQFGSVAVRAKAIVRDVFRATVLDQYRPPVLVLEAVDDCTQTPAAHFADFGLVRDCSAFEQGFAAPEDLGGTGIEAFMLRHILVPSCCHGGQAGLLIDLLRLPLTPSSVTGFSLFSGAGFQPCRNSAFRPCNGFGGQLDRTGKLPPCHQVIYRAAAQTCDFLDGGPAEMFLRNPTVYPFGHVGSFRDVE